MKRIVSIIGHLLMIGIIFYFLWPILNLYLTSDHPVGSDYYNSLTYVNFFHETLRLPVTSWEYFWYRGLPTVNAYPWFHFYLIQPFVHFTDIFFGMELYSVATLFLFFLFSYLLFFEISRSRVFALFLTVILIYSKGVFVSLFQSGFINSSGDQFFLPAALYFATLFLKRGNKKFLLLSGTMIGLALLGHQMVGGFLIGLPVALFLLASRRIKETVLLTLISVFVGSLALYTTFNHLRTLGGTAICTTCDFNLSQIKDLPNILSPVLLLFFGTVWLISKRKPIKDSLFLLSSFIVFSFITWLVISVIYEIPPFSLFSGPLWPHRVVWVWSLGAGILIAALFLEIKEAFNFLKSKFTWLGISGLIFVASLGIGFLKPSFLVPNFENFRQSASGYPADIHQYLPGKYNKYGLSELFPSWLPIKEVNWRFDDRDNGIIFWWNIASRLPVESGSSNVVPIKIDDWHAWLNSAITGEPIKQGRKEETSLNTALFLLDWHAIRYLEDLERYPSSGKKTSYYPYLVNNKEVVDKEEVAGSSLGRFTFFRIKEGVTSPIVQATNAPTVYIVSSENGYLNILKTLALGNLNSQKVIPIKGPSSIDKLRKEDLGKMDAVILYDYQSMGEEKVWTILKKYVEEGGFLIIDTGSEVKESNASLLPEVFPVYSTRREALGKEWSITQNSHPILEEVNFNQFSPLVYEGDPWKLSYAEDGTKIRSWTQILLSQGPHPLLVSGNFGKGKVVWSGMNLFYHAFYYDNLSEVKLLENILGWGIDLKPEKVDFQFERKIPEIASIKSDEDFRGILFKENFERGWVAKANGRGVKIYPAGLDFMYVPLPKNISSPLTVELDYRGSLLMWFLFILSFLTIVIVLEYVVFGGRLTFKPLGMVFERKNFSKSQALRNIAGWWNKEEE